MRWQKCRGPRFMFPIVAIHAQPKSPFGMCEVNCAFSNFWISSLVPSGSHEQIARFGESRGCTSGPGPRRTPATGAAKQSRSDVQARITQYRPSFDGPTRSRMPVAPDCPPRPAHSGPGRGSRRFHASAQQHLVWRILAESARASSGGTPYIRSSQPDSSLTSAV